MTRLRSDLAGEDDIGTYSLVALDIDGTMIGEDRVVRPELIDSISRVQSMLSLIHI